MVRLHRRVGHSGVFAWARRKAASSRGAIPEGEGVTRGISVGILKAATDGLLESALMVSAVPRALNRFFIAFGCWKATDLKGDAADASGGKQTSTVEVILQMGKCTHDGKKHSQRRREEKRRWREKMI
eukprot:RCo014641